MLAQLVIHPPTPKICDCRIVYGWNPRLARIHAVGDSGGSLQNFSLPSRRSPCQVEHGASTVSAKFQPIR
jgi:hypothetical protein